MFDAGEIKAYLELSGRDFVVNVRVRAYDEAILLYIPLDRVSRKVKKGYTSLRQIKSLERHLAERFSASFGVVFTKSESHSDLEAGLFRFLNGRFNNRILSFYISFRDERTIDSWIESKDISAPLKMQVLDYLSELLAGVDLVLGDIQWVDRKAGLPTNPAILRLIKMLQPVEVDVLLESLKENYSLVDEKWLAKTLDGLRRKGLLHWQRPGSYAMTADSLALVPAGARRSSSDIDRALALGRRKW